MDVCPVCYDRNAKCTFICKHAFCYECVQKWYEGGANSCPMCRRSMCFKGITHSKSRWEEQRKFTLFANLVEEIFEDLHDTDDIVFFTECLRIIQERFNYMMSKYSDTDLDLFEWVLRMTWFSVDFIMNESRRRFHESPTFTKYLLVSDTVYGVKNTRHTHTNKKWMKTQLER